MSLQIARERQLPRGRNGGRPRSRLAGSIALGLGWTSLGSGFGDARILAAAERARCRWLLSEDFQAGRQFGSVTIVNPFRNEPGGALELDTNCVLTRFGETCAIANVSVAYSDTTVAGRSYGSGRVKGCDPGGFMHLPDHIC